MIFLIKMFIDRYIIAPDRGPEQSRTVRSWYVVDLESFHEPIWPSYANVDNVAGPFAHASEAFGIAEEMNRNEE